MTVRERTIVHSPRLSRDNLQANYGIGGAVHADLDGQGAAAQAEQSLLQRAIPKLGGGKRLQSFAMWARQTFVLIKSGTPLAQSLQAVEQQAGSGPWREVLKDIRLQIDEGVALSEAMDRHPLYFSAVARSMVAAGESSGELHTMLERLAHLSRQQLRVRRSLLGSMVYPCLLIVVATVVVGAMIGFVLPRFEGLFDTLDAPLPPTTKLLMQASEIFRAHWWAVLLVAFGLAVATRIFAVSYVGKRLLDAWIVRVPTLGRIIRSFETARIARIVGSLVQSKVPLLEALELTSRSTNNTVYSALIADATDAVTRGQSVSSVFAQSPLISPSLTEALRHGEASGQIGSLLTDMADFMDEENEVIVRTLTTIVEPLILIGLGIVVAFIAVSMFLPLFDITSMTQGG